MASGVRMNKLLSTIPILRTHLKGCYPDHTFTFKHSIGYKELGALRVATTLWLGKSCPYLSLLSSRLSAPI
jgi:hypothetical protein